MQSVWYVAYGSNLGFARFRCYLAGGRPSGASREYVGCRDRTEPAGVAALEVSGGLVFAGMSSVWHGGMAFYDSQAEGRVACRAYLLTAEQFGDVTAQEMRRPPGGDFAQDLAGLLLDIDTVHTMGSGRYETITRLGERAGAPMFTVTTGDTATLDLAAPSAPYLRWIMAGLREAHGWRAEGIATYLGAARGLSPTWSREALAALARSVAEGSPWVGRWGNG